LHGDEFRRPFILPNSKSTRRRLIFQISMNLRSVNLNCDSEVQNEDSYCLVSLLSEHLCPICESRFDLHSFEFLHKVSSRSELKWILLTTANSVVPS
jgi:hypothetical protein